MHFKPCMYSVHVWCCHLAYHNNKSFYMLYIRCFCPLVNIDATLPSTVINLLCHARCQHRTARGTLQTSIEVVQCGCDEVVACARWSPCGTVRPVSIVTHQQIFHRTTHRRPRSIAQLLKRPRLILLAVYNHTSTPPLSFYRAMLCIRGTSHEPVSVCVSVRPSQVGVLRKRLNVGLHKQNHTIAQGL